MDFENTTISLAAFFEFIFILYLVTRLILRRRSNSKPKSDFYNTAPFEVEYAVGNRMRVTSYGEIVPHFCIGFDSNQDADIFVSQSPIEKIEADEAGHQFAVSVSLENLKGCGWVSLERTAKALSVLVEYKVNVLVRAKSRTPSKLSAEFCIPIVNEQDRRVILDNLNLTDKYNSFEISTLIKGDMLSNLDQIRNSRVILFLPPVDGTVIEITQFSIELEE